MAEVIKNGNIYEVDGKRYRELSKEPAVGDTVLVIDKLDIGEGYDIGEVHIITKVNSLRETVVNAVSFVDQDGANNALALSEFVIVEPIEDTMEQADEPEESEIAKLVRKITHLEERTEENHRNILTFSQTAETARSTASKAIGGVNALDEQLDLVREDIVFLDEKVSALEEAKPPQNITININVLDIESAKAIVESFTKGRE